MMAHGPVSLCLTPFVSLGSVYNGPPGEASRTPKLSLPRAQHSDGWWVEDVSPGTALKGHPSPRAPGGLLQPLSLPVLPHRAPPRLAGLFRMQFLSSFCTETGVSETTSRDPAYDRGEKLGSSVRPTWDQTPAWPLPNHVTVHRCLYPTEHLTCEHITTARSPARKP